MAPPSKKKSFWQIVSGGSPENGNKPSAVRSGIGYLILLAMIILIINGLMGRGGQEKTVAYSFFKTQILDGQIKRVRLTERYVYGYTMNEEESKKARVNSLTSVISARKLGFSKQTDAAETKGEIIYRTVAPADLGFIALLDTQNIYYWAELPGGGSVVKYLISLILPIIILVIIWRVMMKRMGGGANVMSFNQNKARIVAEDGLKTRFDDVAGCEEAKNELIEVVDFLKHPGRYTEIGGKIPKGALLVGPPGTGKTLLARAVAGEAGVTFFRMSGADFVEMFVGVGAARVRDLFEQARKKAPCIVFIDELDAIGKSRSGAMNSNDEREQTLNQLLVEMDGFDGSSGVILLAATNRPEVLDPALLRPGRFDRQIMVDRPDLKGREAILKTHSKNVRVADDVDFHEVAAASPGFVGADLANVVNEAALLAVRSGRKTVTKVDFDEAIEKSALGLAKTDRVMSKFERANTAYHEAGHALVTLFTAGVAPLRKVTIVPRGFSLGSTWSSPVEGRYGKTTDEMVGDIDVCLAGRAAEEVIYGHISTGAANDIQKATDVARAMIMEYGMSDRFKNVAFSNRKSAFIEGGAMAKEYSEETQNYIDEEIARMMAERYGHDIDLLTRHKSLLEAVGALLLEKESIDAAELIAMVRRSEEGANELDRISQHNLARNG